MIITIDGLGINGKSSLAKMISDKIGFKNFNTGSVYRCIILEIINKNYDINNINNYVSELSKIKIDFEDNKVLLNGRDVTKDIRTEEVTLKSADWSNLNEIKKLARQIQDNYFKENENIIMEGRNIGAVIAPNAEIKFYLYSDFEVRVNRAWKLRPNESIEVIRNNLKIKDNYEINGGAFVKPNNAIEIDTSNLSLEEVYTIMLEKINNYLSKGD